MVDTKKEIIWAFAGKGSSFILFFLLNIYLARTLGVAGYGLWSFFLSALTIILLVSYCGINVSARKYVAQHNGTPALKTVLKSSFQLRVLVSLLMALLLLIISGPLARWMGYEAFEGLFRLAAPLVFISGIAEYFKEVFTGLQKMRYHFWISVLEYGFKLVLVIFFFSFSKGIPSILGAYTFALFMAVLAGAFFFGGMINPKGVGVSGSMRKKILKYAVPLFVMKIGFLVATEIDVLMIGIMKGDMDIGIYAVAKQVVVRLPQISVAISLGTMAVFAKMTEENRKQLQTKFYQIMKINTLIFIGIVILILLSASLLITAFFGHGYQAAALPLRLLTPFLFFTASSAILTPFLDYRGLAGKRMIHMTIAIVLNIILNFALIPRYGATGAALATSVAYFPYVLLNWLEARRCFS